MLQKCFCRFEFPSDKKRPSTEVTTKKSSNKKRAATVVEKGELSEMRLAARPKSIEVVGYSTRQVLEK